MIVNGPHRVTEQIMTSGKMERFSLRGAMSNVVPSRWKIALSPKIFIAIPILCTLVILLNSDQQYFDVWQMVETSFARVSVKTTRIISGRLDEYQNELIQQQPAEINQTNNHQHLDYLEGSQSSTGKTRIDYESRCILSDDCPDKSDVDDRILNQLRLTRQTNKIFKILPPDFSFSEGQEVFYRDSCNINRCHITYNREEADLLVFPNSDVFVEPRIRKREEQIWVAYFLESPIHTFDRKFKRLHRGNHVFNWTASYRSDSDIVTPYSKFVYYDKVQDKENIIPLINDMKTNQTEAQKYYSQFCPDKHKKLIERKSNKVAWFASNCNAANNRLEYAKELSKYIPVDIYGK